MLAKIMMNDDIPKAQTRAVQHLQDITAATSRALCAQRDLHLQGEWFFNGVVAVPLYAPHLAATTNATTQQFWRGRGDAAAQRLLHCDEQLHRQHCPQNDIERMLFELLEQLRCESLAELCGVRHNLQLAFFNWSRQFINSKLAQTMLGLLILTLSQMVYSRLNSCELDAEIADAIEGTRASLAPLLGADLAALRRERNRQQQYVKHALNIVRLVANSIDNALQNQSNSSSALGNSEFKLPLNFTPPPLASFAVAQSGIKNSTGAAAMQYKIWTTKYDREQYAAQLLRSALLDEYRQNLDDYVNARKINVMRFARIFRALLAREHSAGWHFDEESGYLDASRLSNVITRRNDGRVFKKIARPPLTNCIVTLLIDCSGSMKNSVAHFAPFADVFTRIFTLAGADTEVLGFSTQTWNGGRALREWRQQGNPSFPGRLNESLHLIFKTATQSYQRAKKSLAAMYKVDLFREGIDGEALQWAISRMNSKGVDRRLLFVLSDGCPMDRATELANPNSELLERHLRQIVNHNDGRSVEIYGLGIGLDLSLFYRHRLAFEGDNLLHSQTFLDIAAMIGARQKRRRNF